MKNVFFIFIPLETCHGFDAALSVWKKANCMAVVTWDLTETQFSSGSDTLIFCALNFPRRCMGGGGSCSRWAVRLPVVNLNFAISDHYWARSYQSIAFRPNGHGGRAMELVITVLEWLICIHHCFISEVIMMTCTTSKQKSILCGWCDATFEEHY